MFPAMRRALALALALIAAPAAATEVDLELVLAVDMSGSMDREEQRLQRDGWVAAIRSPEVWKAIEGGAWQRIALSYLEWAGWEASEVVMGWRLIDSPAAAEAFAAELSGKPLSFIRGTSISWAIRHSARLFEDNGFEGWRRVIDVSGDGPNNRGLPAPVARDEAVAQGIVINGLPLMIRPSAAGVDLAAYFRACVIGGDGAFVLPVRDLDDFADAARRKMVLEIAGRAPLALVPAQGSPAPVDCLIGEKARRWSDP
jgi:hypothetical protein